ncbi:MAG: DUF2304 domain-containing protein [Candidatus Omnitrophica bacterium]|nr:DUF2304 domain-containing protein [Candidatus Omnitrophota bacterium]
MTLRQKVFTIVASVGIIITIVELVRRRRLAEEYSFLWIVTGLLLLVLSVRFDFLVSLSRFIGAEVPTNSLFIFALIFLVLLCLHFSLKFSQMTNQIKNLAQELSLIQMKIEEKQESGNKEKSG